MDFVKDSTLALEQSQALIQQMDGTPMRDNLKASLELLKKNEALLSDIRSLKGKGGEDATERSKKVLEVNANIFELCRCYASFSDAQ